MTSGKKITTEEFIKKAILIHGDTYCYNKVNYIKNKIEVEIICRIHGSFWQIPYVHIGLRCGCKECGIIKCSNACHYSTEEFIKKVSTIHNNKYDYSSAKYIDRDTKIEIICKIHGSFWQSPSNHIQGGGCQQCGIISRAQSHLYTTAIFIEKAQLIHNKKYNYLKTKYIHNKEKVIITCPKHGDFLQRPHDHLNAEGCAKCISIISVAETSWLDYLGISNELRQKTLYVGTIYIRADAFDPKTNTVYEFYGDFWHGNPNKYNSDEINKKTKCKFGELYQKTIERENLLKNAGYNIVSIWESDWRDRD